MASSVEEVARNAGTLAAAVEETASSIGEMIASIKQVSENTDAVAASAEQTSSSIAQMSTSVKEVEHRAVDSARMAEKVSQDASTRGMSAAAEAMKGMQNIKEAVEATAAVVNRLRKARPQEIGQIRKRSLTKWPTRLVCWPSMRRFSPRRRVSVGRASPLLPRKLKILETYCLLYPGNCEPYRVGTGGNHRERPGHGERA